MNVLIIDDQKSVVSGLMKGIDWERLQIGRVWGAYSSREAKEILAREHVDIMLCDIEMPGEDGLSLFSWVREHDEDIECIFLTAHADFEFAKEALRLGSFDYILQPAPYEDVEDALQKVCGRIWRKREQKRYSSYGKNFYENRDLLLDGFMKDWMNGRKVELSEILKKLEKLQIFLTPETEAVFCVFQILRWEEEGGRLEEGLLRYACHNILSELFGIYGIKVLNVALKADEYAFLFYCIKPEKMKREEVKKCLEEFLDMCRNFYGGTGVCYLGNFCTMEKMQEQIEQVHRLQKNNVAQRGGVFTTGRSSSIQPDSMEWMKGWELELTGGKAQEVKREAFDFLDGNVDAEILKQFYMSFMQVMASACELAAISSYHIFRKDGAFERSLSAYQSIDEMKWMVCEVADFFDKSTSEKDGNYVETVIQYIHCNMEKDIRRSELARMVNLNEDYLSRIFKKEKGISLKEYIILEKMRTAQNLLKNTTFSISTIGTKVGFDNFSHFSQTYKKVMGKTPAEERD